MTAAAGPLAVTGATGFVGQALLDRAAAQGLPVRALARQPQGPREGVEWVRGDLADWGAMAALVGGARAVVHVAGVVNAPDPRVFETGNVGGTEAVIMAMLAERSSRLVFVSSLAAREPGLSAYGASKALAEARVAASGLDWTTVRPPAVYGPRDKDMFELFRAARWGLVPMPAKGRASLIHVDDLARLLLALVEPGADVAARVFEPDDAADRGWAHRDLARALGAAVGRRAVVLPLPRAVMDLAARADVAVRGPGAKLTRDRVGYMCHPDWVADPEKRVPAARWVPEIETHAGLAATAAWYRENGWL